MKSHSEEQLERLLDRELKQLPELRAPETLVHRIMLAVHARQRLPWWKRAWPDWPPPVQAFALGVLAFMGAAVVFGVTGQLAAAQFGGLTAKLQTYGHSLASLWTNLETLTNAVGLVLKAAGGEFAVAGVCMVAVAYLLSMGLFTACYRLAAQKA